MSPWSFITAFITILTLKEIVNSAPYIRNFLILHYLHGKNVRAWELNKKRFFTEFKLIIFHMFLYQHIISISIRFAWLFSLGKEDQNINNNNLSRLDKLNNQKNFHETILKTKFNYWWNDMAAYHHHHHHHVKKHIHTNTHTLFVDLFTWCNLHIQYIFKVFIIFTACGVLKLNSDQMMLSSFHKKKPVFIRDSCFDVASHLFISLSKWSYIVFLVCFSIRAWIFTALSGLSLACW